MMIDYDFILIELIIIHIVLVLYGLYLMISLSYRNNKIDSNIIKNKICEYFKIGKYNDHN